MDGRKAFVYVFACFFTCACLQSAQAEGVKRALLIGIDEYQLVSDLRGTGNDVALMQRVLASKLGYEMRNIKVLRDEQATRTGILRAIRQHLIEPAKPDDHIFLHYSGHGSQLRDVDGDEIDQYDETLVPHDSRAPGVFDITDDEINNLLAELSDVTTNITIVLDSCHSGSATRGGSRARYVPPDERIPPAADRATGRTTLGSADIREMGADYVLITGAAPFQLANETRIGSEIFGVMTYNLARALLSASPSTTYREVMDVVANQVTSAFPSQQPQLEGTAPDTLVFGGVGVTPQAYALVQPHTDGRVTIDHGELHGIRSGVQLSVFAPGMADFGSSEPIAKVIVEQADSFTASGRIVDGSVTVGSRTPVSGFVRGDYVLSVWLPESADKDNVLAAQIGEDPGLSRAESPADAQLHISFKDAVWQLQMGDLTPLGTAHTDAAEAAAALSQWANWFAVLFRSNQEDNVVSLTLQRDGDLPGTEPPDTVSPGEVMQYRVRNNSSEPLHVTVVGISTSGKISPLYYSGAQRLSPGTQTPIRRFGVGLPEGLDETFDFIKVFAGSEKIEPQIFTSASVTGRDTFSLERVDWATDVATFRTQRQRTRATGYVLLLEDASRAVPSSTPNARTVCRAGTNECLEGEALDEEGRTLFVAPQTRAVNTEKFAPGSAFQGAYDLGRDLGVTRVEPVFNVALVDENIERGVRGGFDDDHDPAAAADHLWSVKYVKAPLAWNKLQTQGKLEGAEGRGIKIAHLDTGYRKHPETWDVFAGERPILPDLGIDLIDGDDDPFDPLYDERPLSNPGHGTASGSVIISPPGCQVQDEEEPCMTGVGRGAQLIPVRVHTSVVVLNQRKLARAINAVSEKQIGGDPPLISIAMGGPPSWSLWRAVRKAEKSGIAIIAAAGNNVKLVVWPARFRATIAVGAINVRCRPWTGSSIGRAVDISAPGESVWRAGVNIETLKNEVDMSKGTTFATGTTAGVAALWLASLEQDRLAQLRRSGDLTRVLRRNLQNTSWRPGETGEPDQAVCDDFTWNARRNGKGIVDADALLQSEPTGATLPGRSVAESLDQLPLYASIYPENVPLERVASDYKTIFKADDLSAARIFEVELMFHYTNDRQVRSSFDEIVAGRTDSRVYRGLRARLLRKDLSRDLRRALKQ